MRLFAQPTVEWLVNSSMEPGQDQDDHFMEKTFARSELAKMDEPVSYRGFKDILRPRVHGRVQGHQAHVAPRSHV